MSGNDFFLKHNPCHLQFKKVIYEGLIRGNFDTTGIWDSFTYWITIFVKSELELKD